MTDEPTAVAEDTPTAVPQEETPEEGLTFEFADTPAEGPEATGQQEEASPEEQEKIFGKYTSMEEAERAFKESEQRMHQAAEEASVYKKALAVVQPTPAPHAQPDQEQIDEQFRGHLEQSPWQTLNTFVEHKWSELENQKTQQQSALMQEYNRYANDPMYADVAPQVMQSLALEQNPDVEKLFLRTKIANLQNGAASKAASSAAQGRRMHVESGSSRQAGGITRIEIDPDARRTQKAFGMSDAEFNELNKRVAMQQMSGTKGRAPVSIDDWLAQKGGK